MYNARNASLATLLVLFITGPIVAQVNKAGTIHLGVGLAAGAHATEYRETVSILGVSFTNKSTDGAATVTLPLEFGIGLAKPVSLGIYVEPGSYLDSSATESNGLAMLGLQPRLYLVNGDRFAWLASLRFGGSALVIDRSEEGTATTARYRGGHLGIGTGIAAYFGDHIGLQVHLNYLANNFTLKEYDINGANVPLDNFDAELLTRGIALQASLAFKFK